jgi:exodeoxyribonuclease V alpha subunit
MAEQLSMDFAVSTQPTDSIEAQQEAYEPLDYQLAELFQELNGFSEENKAQNKAIKHCTLEISKHTREGQIAIPVSEGQRAELLQTKVAGEAGDYKPLIIDQGYLYLRRYWQYQQRLADQIQSRMLPEDESADQPDQQDWAQQRLDIYFEDEGLPVDWQKLASSRALQKRFLIISGGPGTGKTTTITRILALLIEKSASRGVAETTLERSDDDPQGEMKSSTKWGGILRLRSGTDSAELSRTVLSDALEHESNDESRPLKILLAAPTGKAAIRMLDSIRLETNALQSKLGLSDALLKQMPTEANTIHKLLGYQHGSVQFKHNAQNPLNADVVLVDEASMIDIALMSKLLEAVPAHAKLILIGDKDQLSSVETGSVFADICAGLEEMDHLVTLKKNWRFSEDSDIGQIAIAANQGDSATLLSTLKDQNRTGCELITPEAMRDAELVKPWAHYFDVLNKPSSTHEQIFEAFNQYRILCALRRGLNGSMLMNQRIGTALAKQDLIKFRRSNNQPQSWYHGRPIMITQNSYSKGLFNGDTGITLIKDGDVKVFFPVDSLSAEGSREYKSFSPVRLPAHETTWAMTIHKSQGSEFDQVVLILPHEVMPLLTRQLIYTGITRAKQKVSMVASEAVLVAGVRAEVIKATRIDKELKSA